MPAKTAIPPKSILRQAGRAIADYKMINSGDRVMLGLSGGKDSMSLLHVLIHLKRHAPVTFDLAAITVDPEMDDFDPSPLKPYLESLGIEYHICAQPIQEQAKKHMQGNSFCAWCARMKRGIIYTNMRKLGFNVLALAQHLDDLAESFLMSAFHEGRLNTMKANYVIDKGDLRVIRPLVYVREAQTRNFAQKAKLPLIYENCPACFAKPTQRQHMKNLLKAEEKSNPHLYKTLLSAMRDLMQDKQ